MLRCFFCIILRPGTLTLQLQPFPSLTDHCFVMIWHLWYSNFNMSFLVEKFPSHDGSHYAYLKLNGICTIWGFKSFLFLSWILSINYNSPGRTLGLYFNPRSHTFESLQGHTWDFSGREHQYLGVIGARKLALTPKLSKKQERIILKTTHPFFVVCFCEFVLDAPNLWWVVLCAPCITLKFPRMALFLNFPAFCCEILVSMMKNKQWICNQIRSTYIS